MIRLHNIQLENFKCFESTPTVNFGRITLLTGANSTGKSSMMYSLLGVLQSENFPLEFTANEHFVEMGSYKDMVFGHDCDKDIKISFILSADGDEYQVSITLSSPRQGTQPYVKVFTCNADYFNLKLTAHSDSIDSSYDMSLKYDSSRNEQASKRVQTFARNFKDMALSVSGQTGVDEIMKFLSAFMKPVSVDGVTVMRDGENLTVDDRPTLMALSMVMADLSKQLKVYNKNLNFITSFRSPARRSYLETSLKDGKIDSSGDGFVMELLRWRDSDRNKYELLKSHLQKVGILYDVEPRRLSGGNFQVDVKVTKESAMSNLSDVGFGVSQVLPIIVADIELGDESTLLSAQPEIHLHPSVQANLADYFVGQINNTGKNYILETHSEYLLNRLRLLIAKGELSQDDICVYYMNQKSGKTEIHEIEFCRNGQILGAPEDFFETYMMDVMNIAMEASE